MALLLAHRPSQKVIVIREFILGHVQKSTQQMCSKFSASTLQSNSAPAELMGLMVDREGVQYTGGEIRRVIRLNLSGVDWVSLWVVEVSRSGE